MAAAAFTSPEPLAGHHDLSAFDSSVPSLDDWLKRRALKNQGNGSSRTYVVCERAEPARVIAYYCLAAGAIGHAQAPSALKRNRPDPVPVLVLGRLAIHKAQQQSGLGTALLRDAIGRAMQAAEIAGVAAILVHALSEPARRFYLSRGFIESPVQPMTLCLMLETVRRA